MGAMTQVGDPRGERHPGRQRQDEDGQRPDPNGGRERTKADPHPESKAAEGEAEEEPGRWFVDPGRRMRGDRRNRLERVGPPGLLPGEDPRGELPEHPAGRPATDGDNEEENEPERNPQRGQPEQQPPRVRGVLAILGGGETHTHCCADPRQSPECPWKPGRERPRSGILAPNLEELAREADGEKKPRRVPGGQRPERARSGEDGQEIAPAMASMAPLDQRVEELKALRGDGEDEQREHHRGDAEPGAPEDRDDLTPERGEHVSSLPGIAFGRAGSAWSRSVGPIFPRDGGF